MKARQYARMLEFEDEDSGLRIKRLWSFHDAARGRRFYADILEMPEEQRKRLIRQYARFVKQLRAVRKAMADYFAGQRFFDFYPGDPEEEDAERARSPPAGGAKRRLTARSLIVRSRATAGKLAPVDAPADGPPRLDRQPVASGAGPRPPAPATSGFSGSSNGHRTTSLPASTVKSSSPSNSRAVLHLHHMGGPAPARRRPAIARSIRRGSSRPSTATTTFGWSTCTIAVPRCGPACRATCQKITRAKQTAPRRLARVAIRLISIRSTPRSVRTAIA